MTNSNRSQVYVNGHIDFLLVTNVQSEIIGKNNRLVHLNFGVWHSDVLEQRLKYTVMACRER